LLIYILNLISFAPGVYVVSFFLSHGMLGC